MDTTTYPVPDVPIPAGVKPDIWQNDVPLPYRILFSTGRHQLGSGGRADRYS